MVDPLKRDFYTEMCRIERWSTRTLEKKIGGTIELLDLEQSGIQVSSYWTEILPKKELERKLHEAVRLARARLPVTPTGTTEDLP